MWGQPSRLSGQAQRDLHLLNSVHIPGRTSPARRIKLVNLTASQTFCCTTAHTSAINNSPRAVVWLAGHNCLQLSSLVRHLMIQEGVKAFNCSGHGTSFGKASQFPKGTFKARTSKRIFSQFSVFRLGLSQKRMRRKWRLPDRKAILLRVFERPTQNPHSKPCHSERLYREEPAVACSSPALAPRTFFPMWKTSGNPVGSHD